MNRDDALFRDRLSLLAYAAEMKNVRAACRAFRVHHSTYYRWKAQVDRYGLEILRPRERRQPRMPNAVSPMIEQKVVAFSLGHPGFGPARIAAELRQERWGGIELSPNGIWRILRRHGLSTRAKRLGLVAGYAAPPAPERRKEEEPRHIDADHPGQLVQMDCLFIGRLSGTKGTVWQYTAIDVASSYTWGSLHVTAKNPAAHWTSTLARHVAGELAGRGWKLEKITTDNASEFRSAEFTKSLASIGVRHVFIHAGRPQSNGCVERVQETVLEECWKPAFARYLVPKYTGLRRDLVQYLRYYNQDRAHTGRWNRGRTPEQVLGKAKIWAR